jgi:hypothetical protein
LKWRQSFGWTGPLIILCEQGQYKTRYSWGSHPSGIIYDDFGKPVWARWSYCSKTFWNYLSFQSVDFERHLMKFILSVTWWSLFWTSPDEVYFERHLMKFILSVTWWSLFWASPNEVYSRNASCTLILISTFFILIRRMPDDGYPGNASCTQSRFLFM